MMEWQPIETAPKDMTRIRLKTPSRSNGFEASWQPGFVDEAGEDCACWVAFDEGEEPPCWTDGVCWASNEDDEPSELPTHWMPLPAAPHA